MALPLGQWLRLSIGGAMASDSWSINPWFKVTGGPVVNQTDLTTIVQNALSDFDAKVWSLVSNGVKLSNAAYCTLAQARGLFYLNNVISQSAVANITAVPGSGSSIHPPYVAMVCTLLTDNPGRRNRGRLYLPATALGVSGTTGQQSGTPNAWATSMASWFNNRAAWLSGQSAITGLQPVVMTQTGDTPKNVTHTKFDTKFDTQRGRENKLVPAAVGQATVT